MMFLLFLLFTCAASVFSEEVVKKQIPIFGPTFTAVIYDEVGRPSYRIFPTPENVYKSVIEKPMVVVSVSPEEGKKHTIQFAPGGLRKLLKDPETKDLAARIIDEKDISIVVYPKTSFPFHFFGESGQTSIHVPEHSTNLETMLEQPTLLVLMRRNQLNPLDSVTKLGNVAELMVEGNDIRVGKEYKTPMPYHTPNTIPLDSNLYLVYPDTRNPGNNGPSAPHLATPIPALPPLHIPGNVGPFFV